MANHRPYNQSIEIFSGALWSQRHQWRRAMQLLPANSCILVVNPENKRQTQMMRKLAQSFRDTGRQVLIWISPAKAKNFEHQK